jgi:hypothetical protein
VFPASYLHLADTHQLIGVTLSRFTQLLILKIEIIKEREMLLEISPFSRCPFENGLI